MQQHHSTLSVLEERDRLLNTLKGEFDMFEQASAMQRLCSLYGFTQASLAGLIKVSQSTVGNKIRLLSFTPPQRANILKYRLTERHARALLGVPPQIRESLIETVGKARLNVRQTEELVEKYKQDASNAGRAALTEGSTRTPIESLFEDVVGRVKSMDAENASISCISESGDGWQRMIVTVIKRRST